MTVSDIEELSDVIAEVFQNLVRHTHVCVTQHFGDGENYKHYFSRHPMMYTFIFVDELCNRYSLEGFQYRYALLMSIFTNAFSLKEDEAKAGVEAAMNVGLEGTKRTVQEQWQLGEIIYRLAKRDFDAFSLNEVSRQQIDTYSLLLLLER